MISLQLLDFEVAWVDRLFVGQVKEPGIKKYYCHCHKKRNKIKGTLVEPVAGAGGFLFGWSLSWQQLSHQQHLRKS